ncbi:MAG: glycerol-3-phosphate acyltransferase [Candidatus Pacebacteria bacterium]|nr:glycerol-3-phosphate acyltransferase [Candidatus Paceibacterota bacterium]
MNTLLNSLWIVLSYLLGAIPFGFLISKYSKNIDIRKVGRKQIGASNVYHTVGHLEGALTGVLDVAKGWIVVFLAQKFHFPISIQLFSGLVAIIGHNWPIYLNFFGGRGVATTLGATLALNPIIFFYSAIPLAVIGIIWDGAPATILFLVAYFILADYKHEPKIFSVFIIFVFVIILLKRISIIKEDLLQKKLSFSLVLNRLIFDRAEGIKNFRWTKK